MCHRLHRSTPILSDDPSGCACQWTPVNVQRIRNIGSAMFPHRRNGFRVKQQSFGDQNSLRTCPLISILIYIAACSHTGKPDERFPPSRVFHRHHRKFRPVLFISAVIEKLHDAVFCFRLRRVCNTRLPRPSSQLYKRGTFRENSEGQSR